MLTLKYIVVVAVLAPVVLSVTPGCIGKPYGYRLPDFEDCHGYLLCHGGNTYPQLCPYGTKFDEVSKQCKPGKCPPCYCLPPNPTTTTPEPTTTTPEPTTTTPEPTSTTPEPTTTTPEPTTTTPEPTTTTPEPTTTTPEPTTTTPEPTTPEPTTPEPTTTSPEPTTTTPEPTTTTPEATTTTPEPTTTSPEPTTTTAEPATTTAEPATTTTTTTTPNPENPINCLTAPNGSFHADPYHCRKYWVCSNYVAIELFCELGLWFDGHRFVCNYPSQVNCPAGVD